MKGITKAGFLSFLCGQSFGWFGIKVIIQVKVLELFSMDEKIEDIMPLPTNLQPNFDPIQLRALKELGTL